MSQDAKIKKLAGELYAETNGLLDKIQREVSPGIKTGGVYSSAAISKQLAKELLELLDPEYFKE